MTKLNKNMPAKGGSSFGGNFKKDLLLIDLEATGLDAARHEIIQIAAILLDKKTLKEKEVFSSYVKPSKWAGRDLESMKVNGIALAQLKGAPDLKKVLGSFNKLFNPKTVILSYYGGLLDMDFLRAAYKKIGLMWEFDYHYLNLWGVFYSFLAAKNRLNNKKKFAGFSLEDLMKRFKIKSKSRHDALEDCRIEAEVLRRVVSSI